MWSPRSAQQSELSLQREQAYCKREDVTGNARHAALGPQFGLDQPASQFWIRPLHGFARTVVKPRLYGVSLLIRFAAAKSQDTDRRTPPGSCAVVSRCFPCCRRERAWLGGLLVH